MIEEITKTAALEKAKKALEGEIQQLMQSQPKELGEVLTELVSAKKPNRAEFDNAFEKKLKSINQESTNEKKQTSIKTIQDEIVKVRDNLQEKMESLVTKWKGVEKLTEDEIKQLGTLNDLLGNIEDKLTRLGGESSKILEQRARESSFERLIRTIKEFFARLVLSLRSPKNEQEISAKIDEVTNFQYQLKPVHDFIVSLDTNISFLRDRVIDLSKQADTELTRQGVQALQERAELLNNALRVLEAPLSNVEEVEKSIQDLIDGFDVLKERSLWGLQKYGRVNDALFDRLLIYYRDQFQPNLKDITKVYESLGLNSNASDEALSAAIAEKLNLPRNASREAISEKIKQLEQQRFDKSVLAIAKMLNNPISKATYDAFLKDYNYLTANKKDIQNTSPESKNYLNTKGALSKIELKQGTLNKIDEIVSSIQPFVLRELKATLDAIKNQIALAQNKLDRKIQSTSEVTPGGGY